VPPQTVPPEPVQPVYGRYWLHGKGPAPAGNMPVAVHLSPGELALDDGRPALLRLTVAAGAAGAAGTVELGVPAGILAQPAGSLRYDIAPRGYLGWDVTVQAEPGTAAGRRFLTARITSPDGQVIEDSALLALGQPVPPATDVPLVDFAIRQQSADDAQAGELELTVASPVLALRPGQSGPIEVRLASTCASQIRGEAQLVSPYGSWHQAGPWTRGFSVPPGAAQTLRFDVTAAPTARPGEQWWAIVKVMYFGRARYCEPVEVTIT
jgi:alpha-mannosidase